MKKCLIIGNGRLPKKNNINYLAAKGYDTIICADGGAEHARKLKIIPDFIIGDFDSVSKNTLNYFRNKSKIIEYTRQNDTDIEKCIKLAIRKKYHKVILLSVTGDRLDHTFCNLGVVLKFSDRIEIELIHENSHLSLMKGKNEIECEIGETISLYGFDEETKVTSNGLKYRLNNTTLPFGMAESTSNIAVKTVVSLNIKDGSIFVIRDFNVMKRNDFVK